MKRLMLLLAALLSIGIMHAQEPNKRIVRKQATTLYSGHMASVSLMLQVILLSIILGK